MTGRDADDGRPARAVRYAALAVAAYAVAHHLGGWLGPLGTSGPAGARWADWLDLAVPPALLVPAALALRAASADLRAWVLLGAGALLYVEGHGIHLAANSVSNVDTGPTAHLWDEVVGHHLWYAGAFLVAAALVRAVGASPWPARAAVRAGAVVLAAAAGVTAGTNALEGGTAALTGAAAVAGLVVGARRRTTLAGLLVVAAVAALVVVAGWGVVHGGFPQPSSL